MLFVGLRVVTPSDGGRIVFYGDAWSSAGVRIEPIDAPAPGLGEATGEDDGVGSQAMTHRDRAATAARTRREVIGWSIASVA